MRGVTKEGRLGRNTEKTGLIDTVQVMDVGPEKPPIGGDEGQVHLAPNPVIPNPEISKNAFGELVSGGEHAIITDGTVVVEPSLSAGPVDVIMKESDQNPNLASDNVSSTSKPRLGLSLLANYGSDSNDSDDNVDNETPPINALSATAVIQPVPVSMDFQTNYRVPSSEESESDSSETTDDDSSSSSSSEPSEGVAKKKKNTSAEECSVADVEEVTLKQLGVPRTKGEVTLDDLPPIADLQISVPEEECLEMGFISSIVEQQVVVQAKQNFPPLNLDTVLFVEQGRRPLGAIFDVLGQVSEPFYSVRFNSPAHVKERQIKAGMAVYYVPNSSQHTSYVFVDQLMAVKGTDSSWEHNNEPPPTCLDFSDDEAEINARRAVQGDDPAPRKRVNSFERRMNERNLRKSALPSEPRAPPSGPARGRNDRRPFAGQPRTPRPSGHQPRPSGPPPQRARPGLFGRGGGYGFGPVQSQPLAFQHAHLPPMRFVPPAPASSRPPASGMAYPMQPGGQSMYPSSFVHSAPHLPFPVLLRPARFQGGPARYEGAFSPPGLPFTPCYPPHAYSPMFAGVPMFNPGFPPPQLPPRNTMYPPPRGGV